MLLRNCLIGLVLLFTAGPPLRGQEDSLLAVVEQPENDTADLQAMYELAKLYIREDAARALVQARLLGRASQERQLPRWAGLGFRTAGVIHFMAGELDSMQHYNELALRAIGDPKAYPDVGSGILVNIATCYLKQSKYDEAANYFDQALTLAGETGYQQDVSRITNNLGVLYRRLGRPASARRTYEKALALRQRSNDSLGMANTLYNLGSLVLETGEDEAALAHLERAEEIYLALRQPAEIPLITISKGLAYYQRKAYGRAKELLESAMQEPALELTAELQAKVSLALADVYYQEGKWELALNYLLAGEPAAQASGLRPLMTTYDRLFGQVYASLNRHREAVAYFSSFADSIGAVHLNQRLIDQQEVAGKYEAELREAEISRQEVELARQRQRQQLLWLGLGGLALLSASIFLLLRSRLKIQQLEARRREAEQQAEVEALSREAEMTGLRAMIEGQEVERRRVAKDLHDGLGGLLATVKARLSSEAPAAAGANQLIDRACTEVRRIAHNMMPQSLALSGLSGSVRDIVAQLNQRGLDTELEIIGQPDLRLSEDGQAMLLRILQELTHNVVKHAKANKLFIQLLDQPSQLLLTVEDDGVGFNADYATSTKPGIGLENIASRVAYLRGDIQYDSSPGHGTTVSLTIPL